jgi:hypothetical protein
MPPRTNAFQRLILLIERQLAPRGARIVESALVEDSRDRTPREIDIAIEVPIGARTLVVAVECIDHRRKADVQWVDTMIGKYRDLPVDRVIAVSKSGFTMAAKRKASLNRIDAISFADAERIDWDAAFGTPVAVEYQHIQVRIGTIQYQVETDFDFTHWPTDVIMLADVIAGNGERLGSVRDVCQQIRDLPGPRDQALEALDAPGGIRAVVRGEMPSGTRMIFATGYQCQLFWIDLELHFSREDVSVPLEHVRYGESHVAHAESARDGHRLHVAAVRRSDGSVGAGLLVDVTPGRTLTVLDQQGTIAENRSAPIRPNDQDLESR